jgi:hypothetical protein
MNDSLHDDDFQSFQKTAGRWMILNAILGFAFFAVGFLLVVVTIYFFLAAAGVVPPMDLVPWVPYV